MSEIRPDASTPGRFRVSGELVFDTVPELLESGRALLGAGTGSIVLDLQGVTRADSAGLALLVEWLRMARRDHRELTFHNMPAKLLAMAGVSGLDDVLPVADGIEPATDKVNNDSHA